jgi:UDP-3-O-[3-hydroxymyristoyl] glucosamine N-acyltransferase
VLIGGQVGIVGHIEIADGTQIQAQSGVTTTTKAGARLYGSPALDYTGYLRSYAEFRRLPDLARQLNQLQKKIDALQKELERLQANS